MEGTHTHTHTHTHTERERERERERANPISKCDRNLSQQNITNPRLNSGITLICRTHKYILNKSENAVHIYYYMNFYQFNPL